jgi:hypothetical protein
MEISHFNNKERRFLKMKAKDIKIGRIYFREGKRRKVEAITEIGVYYTKPDDEYIYNCTMKTFLKFAQTEVFKNENI